MTAHYSTRLFVIVAGIGLGLLQPLPSGSAQTPVTPAIDGGPLVTIKELMEKTVTPATNTLWNVPEAPTDAEWATLEEAAVTLLVAANVVALGGTGPMDNVWVKDPAWAAFNRVMVAAGRDALTSIRDRDPAALLRAGDILYPPCEGCHAQFNPAVVKAPE
jgi:hypothetical protein